MASLLKVNAEGFSDRKKHTSYHTPMLLLLNGFTDIDDMLRCNISSLPDYDCNTATKICERAIPFSPVELSLDMLQSLVELLDALECWQVPLRVDKQEGKAACQPQSC